MTRNIGRYKQTPLSATVMTFYVPKHLKLCELRNVHADDKDGAEFAYTEANTQRRFFLAPDFRILWGCDMFIKVEATDGTWQLYPGSYIFIHKVKEPLFFLGWLVTTTKNGVKHY